MQRNNKSNSRSRSNSRSNSRVVSNSKWRQITHVFSSISPTNPAINQLFKLNHTIPQERKREPPKGPKGRRTHTPLQFSSQRHPFPNVPTPKTVSQKSKNSGRIPTSTKNSQTQQPKMAPSVTSCTMAPRMLMEICTLGMH